MKTAAGAPEKRESKPALHLVGLLDLLGYSQLVEEFQHNPSVVQDVESVFTAALKMMESMKSASLGKHSAEWNMMTERMNFRLISDTALITMPFSELSQLAGDMKTGENFAVWTESFLDCICLFCLVIAGKLGYFFRGGIALGQHYESNPCNSRNLFMFSQALVDANKLMKKEQDRHTPRILVDEGLFRFLGQHGTDNFLQEDGWVFEENGNMVLNVYNAIPVQPKKEGTTAPLLSDIRKALSAGFKKHGHKEGVAPKYEWLIRYHNRQVSERFGRPDLKVDV